MTDKNKNDENLGIPANAKQFDLLSIDAKLAQTDVHEEDGDLFTFWREYKERETEKDPKADFEKYFVSIHGKDFTYTGVLTNNLKKDDYGTNLFDNGDEYFGQWKKDKKEGYGIYYFKPKENDSERDIYIGEFKNNVKSQKGLYASITKFDDKKMPIEFTISIGDFDNDLFVGGKIISLMDGKRKIYKGKISENGKKNDDNALIIEEDNKIFHGIVKDNIMIEGRNVIMKNNQKESGYYFSRVGENPIDAEIQFDYSRDKDTDEEYIKKLNIYNSVVSVKDLQDTIKTALEFKTKLRDFDYMRNLEYENAIKKVLQDKYGQILYVQ